MSTAVLVFDIETSGPVMGQHHIVSIGACVYDAADVRARGIRWATPTLSESPREIGVYEYPALFEFRVDISIPGLADYVRNETPLGVLSLSNSQFKRAVQSWPEFKTAFDSRTFSAFWCSDRQLSALRVATMYGDTPEMAITKFDAWLERVSREMPSHPYLATDNALFDPVWLNAALQQAGKSSISEHFHRSRRRVIDTKSFEMGLDFTETYTLRSAPPSSSNSVMVIPIGYLQHDPLCDAKRIALTFLHKLEAAKKDDSSGGGERGSNTPTLAPFDFYSGGGGGGLASHRLRAPPPLVPRPPILVVAYETETNSLSSMLETSGDRGGEGGDGVFSRTRRVRRGGRKEQARRLYKQQLQQQQQQQHHQGTLHAPSFGFESGHPVTFRQSRFPYLTSGVNGGSRLYESPLFPYPVPPPPPSDDPVAFQQMAENTTRCLSVLEIRSDDDDAQIKPSDQVATSAPAPTPAPAPTVKLFDDSVAM